VFEIGNEIWQQSLVEAIGAAAELVVIGRCKDSGKLAATHVKRSCGRRSSRR
jgi:hypothetical protein